MVTDMSITSSRYQIDAVVFDCDGVLVDSETINNEVLAELATEAGIPTTFEECVARYMGRSTAECIAEIETSLGRAIEFDFAATYEERVFERAGELRAVPGVAELLNWLDSLGVPRCVASSGTPTEIQHRLAVTQLAKHFGPYVFSATMVRRGKPAPDLFIYAADHLGVPPTKCLLVEDSPYGVRGGRAAGMRVVGFAALASVESLMHAGAHFVVRSMAELQAVLVVNDLIAASSGAQRSDAMRIATAARLPL